MGYPALEELALCDRSQLGAFMRSICCGDGTLPADVPVNDPEAAVLHGTFEAKKHVLASFVASQFLLGRQVREGHHTVGALQSMMASGNSMVDASPFGECLRSMDVSAHCHLGPLRLEATRSLCAISLPPLQPLGFGNLSCVRVCGAGVSAAAKHVMISLDTRGRHAHAKRIKAIRSGDVV